MGNLHDDPARSAKPVTIPSVRPPTEPHPIIPPEDDAPATPEPSRRDRRRSGGGGV